VNCRPCTAQRTLGPGLEEIGGRFAAGIGGCERVHIRFSEI
jgi:hypothetical protein